MLFSSVGNNLTNREDDVLQVKNHLSRAGIFDNRNAPEPHGFITREMDEGIEEFQKIHDLKIDGKLFPGGETENALFILGREDNMSKPVEYDATGRMKRGNGIIAKQEVKRRPGRFIKNLSDDEKQNEPVEYDATGRMIRPKADADTETVPIPQRKPEVPERFEQNNQSSEKDKLNHTIDSFVGEIFKDEGGFTSGRTSANAIDPKGKTNIGITSSTLQEYEDYKKSRSEPLPQEFTREVKEVSGSLAKKIYDEMYYKRYRINEIPDKRLAGHLLDVTINPGPARAGMWLQEELNKHAGENLAVDGNIGSATIKAVKAIKDPEVLRDINNAIAKKRADFYIEKAKNPQKKGFLKGWLNRASRYEIPLNQESE